MTEETKGEKPEAAPPLAPEESVKWSPSLIIFGIVALGLGIFTGLFMSTVTLFK
jgi:hypothetical protein